jgi:hypothetical protein
MAQGRIIETGARTKGLQTQIEETAKALETER